MRSLMIGSVAVLTSLLGCDRSGGQRAVEPNPPEMRRTAAEAQDLRALLAAVAASRACERLEGQFRPLEGRGDTKAATGVLWLERCRARADGADVDLALSGRAWQWVDKQTETVEATFSVDQYVRFEAQVRVRGTMDAAYAEGSHVATIWFTPEEPPTVDVTPIGDVSVDEEGAWAEVVGAAASLFGSGPEARAEDTVEEAASTGLRERLGKGFAATIDLCTGRVATGLGHPEAGEMLETSSAREWSPALLHPRGLLLDGPHPAGTRVELEAEAGAVDARLVCAEDAARLAQAFLAGEQLPAVDGLARARLERGTEALAAEDASCEVVLATAPGGDGEARYRVRFEEPGGDPEPIADCDQAE